MNQLLTIANLTQRIAMLSERCAANTLDFSAFHRGVCLLSGIGVEGDTMTAEKTPVLRRKSMELLKDLTQILRDIIGSDDEERFRRLEETIRAIAESCPKPGRTLH